MPTDIVAFAQTVADLGLVGLLSLIFVLFLQGKLHTEQEKSDWKELYTQERDEKLRAIQDRKESDQAVEKLTERLREHDEIMVRSLDLNERLVDEVMKTPKRRGSI